MRHCCKGDQQEPSWQLSDRKTKQATDETLITSVYPFVPSVLKGNH